MFNVYIFLNLESADELRRDAGKSNHRITNSLHDNLMELLTSCESFELRVSTLEQKCDDNFRELFALCEKTQQQQAFNSKMEQPQEDKKPCEAPAAPGLAPAVQLLTQAEAVQPAQDVATSRSQIQALAPSSRYSHRQWSPQMNRAPSIPHAPQFLAGSSPGTVNPSTMTTSDPSFYFLQESQIDPSCQHTPQFLVGSPPDMLVPFTTSTSVQIQPDFNFNFLPSQESQIDLQSPHMDPAAQWYPVPEYGVKVIGTENEFDRKETNKISPAVIFSEDVQDWTSSEFSFGFDVEEELLANTNIIEPAATHAELTVMEQESVNFKISTDIVPDHKYSLLVGRGGETIDAIREESGAHVTIKEKTDKPPIKYFEVTYSGTVHSVSLAKVMVDKILK